MQNSSYNNSKSIISSVANYTENNCGNSIWQFVLLLRDWQSLHFHKHPLNFFCYLLGWKSLDALYFSFFGHRDPSTQFRFTTILLLTILVSFNHSIHSWCNCLSCWPIGTVDLDQKCKQRHFYGCVIVHKM